MHLTIKELFNRSTSFCLKCRKQGKLCQFDKCLEKRRKKYLLRFYHPSNIVKVSGRIDGRADFP